MKHLLAPASVVLGLLTTTIPFAVAEENSGANVPIILAQSNDAQYRVNLLEEQVRQLNGRIEELNFQILELQELIRRIQEDNDYRLREIEDKLGNVDGGSQNLAGVGGEENSLEKPEPSEQTTEFSGSDGNGVSQEQNKTTRIVDGVEIYQGESGIDENLSGTLGTIQFDENGNVVDSSIGKPLDLTPKLNSTGQNPLGDILAETPEALFSVGYDYVQTGRYGEAEEVFTQFSHAYPDHPRLSEARFWLGESYLGRRQYEAAAKVYLDAHQNWPNSTFGAQTLLKLGVAVAGLNQRELACATYAEVLQKYPDASRAVRKGVLLEQQAANCATN